MKSAVLFDLDGVLLDSMPYHIQAWQTVMAPLNLAIRPDDIYSREGTRTADLARILLDHYGVRLPDPRIDQLVREKSATYNQISQASIMPGTEELLSELKRRHVALAIVTSSFKENLMRFVPERILTQFDTLITGGEVTHGKPHPEPYLLAADNLRLAPSACVVIENARIGVESARAAGMPCVAITSTQSPALLRQADMVVADLPVILAQLDQVLSLEGQTH